MGILFSFADLSQQIIEPRDCNFKGFAIGVGGLLEELVEPIGGEVELLQVFGRDRLAGRVLSGLNLACDPVPDIAFAILMFSTHGPTTVDP